MDDYFDRVFGVEAQSYPPYNLVQVNEDESQLEMVAGFTDQEVKVYTEKGNLVVEGKKAQPMIVNMSIVGWHNGPSPAPGPSLRTLRCPTSPLKTVSWWSP